MANTSMLFGRSSEHLVISKFLAEGREVYVPLVDDHGVDLIVVPKEPQTAMGEPVGYQEIQVKSLSAKGRFAAITCPNPRPNYWFIFYVQNKDTFWLINSMDFVKIASQNGQGKNVGKYSLLLASDTKRGPVIKHQKYVVTDFSLIP